MSGDGIAQGAVVTFEGGLGRGDDPAVLHTGIVNGPTYFSAGMFFVPVHIRELNHNMIVSSHNIVQVMPS